MQQIDIAQLLHMLPQRLTASDIEQQLGIKSQALRNRWKTGQFPKPHKDQGSKINRWWKDEIIQHYNSQTTQP